MINNEHVYFQSPGIGRGGALALVRVFTVSDGTEQVQFSGKMKVVFAIPPPPPIASREGKQSGVYHEAKVPYNRSDCLLLSHCFMLPSRASRKVLYFPFECFVAR